MSVTGAIDRLQHHARNLSGMRFAPDEPPESVAFFPFAVSYEQQVDYTSNRMGKVLDNVVARLVTEIHVGRSEYQYDIPKVQPFRDAFVNAIRSDPSLNGEIQIIENVAVTFGFMEWSQIKTMGYRFTVSVRLKEC